MDSAGAYYGQFSDESATAIKYTETRAMMTCTLRDHDPNPRLTYENRARIFIIPANSSELMRMKEGPVGIRRVRGA